MKAYRVFMLLLVVLCPRVWANEPLSILGYTSSSSFWMNLTAGWQSDEAAAKRYGAIFILHQAGFTFNTAPVVIVASAYHGDTLKDAMERDASEFRKSDPQIHISAVRSLIADKGARFLVREFRSAKLKEQGYESVAYHREGHDVVVFTLSAQSNEALKQEAPIFHALLKSFVSSKLKVKVEQ